MCGIVGYLGTRNASDVLLKGLEVLEYRGYDSAGITVATEEGFKTIKREGKINILCDAVKENPLTGNVGIGHTRWASQGDASEKNAHPHTDCTGKLSVVHNGNIENYVQLKEELIERGHTFTSDTDTEAVVHLIEEFYEGDLLKALAAALKQVSGAWSIAVMHEDNPDQIAVARYGTPLIIGLGHDENFLASDIPAVHRYTEDIIALEDGQFGIVEADAVKVFDENLVEVEPKKLVVDWDLEETADKGGFKHFMLKEINEQPNALIATMKDRFVEGKVSLSELDMNDEEIRNISRIVIIACGTSYNAGLVGKNLIEKWVRIPVEVEVSSEFRYNDPIIDDRTLLVAITQSGETADTIEGMKEAKAKGARTMCITNVVGSTVTRYSDGIIYTQAGTETAVAATKSFTTQLIAIYVLAARLGQAYAKLDEAALTEIFAGMAKLPGVVARVIETSNAVREVAADFVESTSALFLARGINAPIANEGSLKLKEISYIHAEAYPAGEMKHGPIALIDEGFPVIGIAPQSETYDKVISNMREVKTRKGKIMLVLSEGDVEAAELAEGRALFIPQVPEYLSPIPAIVSLQLFAYHVADLRGQDIDKPRNLAKSVTVE